MQINTFNNLNIIQKYFNINSQVKRGLYPNLSPLKEDTISFGAAKYLESESMSESPQSNICKKVSENAEPAFRYLKTVMDKYIKPCTKDYSKPPEERFEVFKYKTRKKSISSMKEKVVSKFTQIYNDDLRDFSSNFVTQLMKYFNPAEKVSKNDLIEETINIIKCDNKSSKIYPFMCSNQYCKNIFENLVLREKIDSCNINDKTASNIISNICNEILEIGHNSNYVSDGVYYPTTTVDGIKHYVNDIIGARILMNASSPEYTGKVLAAIEQAVKDNVLKITSIECIEPDPKKLPKGAKIENYLYATPKQLNSLKKVSGAELVRKKSKSGYMAIHINLDLSNEKLTKKFNGFSGEIQIIGADVEQLKDVEDLCYKIKDNKPGIRSYYKDFVDHFTKYYLEADAKTKSAFDNYTYDLYLHQRSIPVTQRSKKFPSIKDMGYENQLPNELDYNVLKTLKAKGDKLKEIDEATESATSILK